MNLVIESCSTINWSFCWFVVLIEEIFELMLFCVSVRLVGKTLGAVWKQMQPFRLNIKQQKTEKKTHKAGENTAK